MAGGGRPARRVEVDRLTAALSYCLNQIAPGRGENGDFENRSAAYIRVREHRKRRNRHLQPGMATFRSDTQVCRISVPSTFRHSRMKAASPVQPLAETIVPST